MTQTCYHCHEAIPAGLKISVTIAGAERPMCCAGCAAVAEMIQSSGLRRYYDLREAVGDRPSAEERAWEIYDRPAIRRAVTHACEEDQYELLARVPSIKCGACTWLIETALIDMDGVNDVVANAATQRLRIVFDSELVLSRLLSRLDRLGFRAEPISPEAILSQQRTEKASALKRLAVAGLGMMQVMMFAVALYAGYFDGMDTATRDFLRLFSLLVATPVVFYSGLPFFVGAWRGLRARAPGMDLPVAIAVGAAYGASAFNTFGGGGEVYFDSAVMFVFLLSAARWVEMAARHRSVELGDAASDELPPCAFRETDGQWLPVALAELGPGDTIQVGAGEIVPADCRVLSDRCRVDESLLTGESVPVIRQRGDTVIAGSQLLGEGARLSVQRVGKSTLLSSIRRLLERARATRPSQIAIADRLARYLVVAVLLITTGTFVIWLQIDPSRAFEVALAVLVVTCPCALSLATPSALSAASSALIRAGVLVVSPAALEVLARVNRVVFDKTGTLTTGVSRLLQTDTSPGISEQRALAVAAALERGCRHPVARALGSFDQGLEVRWVKEHPGEGVSGEIEGVVYRLGKPSFVSMDSPSNASSVDLGNRDGVLARLQLGETLRTDAGATIAALDMPVALLSGDAASATREVALASGIDRYEGRMTPSDKLRRLRELQAQGHTVLMVGDGANDAPVLAGADVSIAMGRGSAMATRQADLIVLGERLWPVATAVCVAGKTQQILRQNLRWALCYNIAAIPLAACGMIPPWLAAIGMSASSLLVVLNSNRIAGSQPQRDQQPVNGTEPVSSLKEAL